MHCLFSCWSASNLFHYLNECINTLANCCSQNQQRDCLSHGQCAWMVSISISPTRENISSLWCQWSHTSHCSFKDTLRELAINVCDPCNCRALQMIMIYQEREKDKLCTWFHALALSLEKALLMFSQIHLPAVSYRDTWTWTLYQILYIINTQLWKIVKFIVLI